MKEEKTYYTLEQVAEVLQVSLPVVRALIEEKAFPAVKLGRRITRVPVDSLKEWVEQQLGEEWEGERLDHLKQDKHE